MSKKLQNFFTYSEDILKTLGIPMDINIKPYVLLAKLIGNGCKSTHLIIFSVIIIFFLLIFRIGAFLISTIFGFLYPAYMSYKCLESQTSNIEDHK